MKRYCPKLDQTLLVLQSSQEVIASKDQKLASYLKNQIQEILAEVTQKDIKKLWEDLEKIKKKVSWLNSLVKGGKKNVADLEQRLGVLQSIENRLQAVRSMKEEAKKLLGAQQERIMKELNQIEKELERAHQRAMEAYAKLSKKEIPKSLENLGRRIKQFFAQRAPKGVKFSTAVTLLPKRGIENPTIIFAYHIIAKGVPSYSDPKKKKTVVLTVGLRSTYSDKKGEGYQVVFYHVGPKIPSPVELLKALNKPGLKTVPRTWKSAAYYLAQEAARQDAVILKPQKMLKIKRSIFRSLGFDLKGLDIKVTKTGQIEFIYTPASHKTLKGRKTKNWSTYSGHDVIFTVEGGKLKAKPSTELIVQLTKGLVLSSGLGREKKWTNTRIVYSNSEWKNNKLHLYFRYFPIPDMEDVI